MRYNSGTNDVQQLPSLLVFLGKFQQLFILTSYSRNCIGIVAIAIKHNELLQGMPLVKSKKKSNF